MNKKNQTTNQVAVFFASYPINKKDRQALHWYKKAIEKHFKTIMKKHKKAYKHILKNKEVPYSIEELNVFLILSMKLPAQDYETKETRIDFETRLTQIHEKYLDRTKKHVKKQIMTDLEFTETVNIFTQDIPETKEQANTIQNQIYTSILEIYDESKTIIWDLPGTAIDRIIIDGKTIDKGIKVISTLYETPLYQNLQKQGKDHNEIIATLTRINTIIHKYGLTPETTDTEFKRFLEEPQVNHEIKQCGLDPLTCRDSIKEFYQHNYMALLESNISDVSDELSFLSLATALLPHLSTFATLPDLETLIQQNISNFQAILSDTVGVSPEQKKHLEQYLSIFVGKVLGAREHLWFLRKILDRILQLKDELEDEAQSLNDEEIANLYSELLDETRIVDLHERTYQIEKFIDVHANQIRTLTYQLSKATISQARDNNSSSMIHYSQVYKDVIDFYYQIDTLRLFLQNWSDVPYFTTVLAGIAQETGTSKQKHKDTPYIIETQNVYKRYVTNENTVYALRGINLKINPGEYVAIIGPSGSGKTTLLNVLSGLDKPDRGEIFINGVNVPLMSEKELVTFRRHTIAYIFQDFLLLPEYNALENVELPGLYAHTPKVREKTIALLKQVGIHEYHTHLPTELSGGQQQRVAVARAFINSPKVLFADEPTGSLDHETGNVIMELIEAWNQEGTTVIVVTHDLEVAKRAQRVFIMFDGKIKKEIDPKTADLKKEMEQLTETTITR